MTTIVLIFVVVVAALLLWLVPMEAIFKRSSTPLLSFAFSFGSLGCSEFGHRT